MWVGLCWPAPGAQFDDGFLRHAKAELPGVTRLRFDVDHRTPHTGTLMDQAQAAGWIPLPVLDIDYPRIVRASRQTGGEFARALWPFLSHAIALAENYAVAAIEVLNEPKVMADRHGGEMPPDVYARVCNAIGDEFTRRGLAARLIAAGDMLQPDRKGPKRLDWWARARNNLRGDLYDAVAVHPYREPGPPSVSRWDSRAEEFGWIRRQAAGKPILVTEVGWRVGPGGVSEEQQAAYLVEELALAKAAEVEGVCVYAHAGEFGLFGDWPDFRPRPAVGEINAWCERT